jgi:coenzyme PQQ precursor peptide PqqA
MRPWKRELVLFSKSHPPNRKEMTMSWNTPAFTEMRYGFEVTMYICNR